MSTGRDTSGGGHGKPAIIFSSASEQHNPVDNDWRYSLGFMTVITIISSVLTGVLIRFWLEQDLFRKYPVAWTLKLEFPTLLGSALLAYIVMKLVFRSDFEQMGIRFLRPGSGRQTGRLLVNLGTLCLVFWTIILLPIALTSSESYIEGTLGKNFFYIFVEKPNEDNVRLFLHLVFLAGLVEEILARGVVQTVLRKRYDVVVTKGPIRFNKSTVYAALLYALWRADLLSVKDWTDGALVPIKIIVIFPFSYLISYIYEKTRSLMAPIILHNIMNTGQLLLIYLIFSILKI